MDPFESLVSEFAGKAGLALQSGKDGSVDLAVDGVDVSVQYRPDRGDCVMFTLPLYDAEPEPCMQRRALELAADGSGTGGHFLGIRDGMFVLSSVARPDELSVEEFAKRRGMRLRRRRQVGRGRSPSREAAARVRSRVRSGGLVAVRVILCATSDSIQAARVKRAGCLKRGRRHEVRSDETERAARR